MLFFVNHPSMTNVILLVIQSSIVSHKKKEKVKAQKDAQKQPLSHKKNYFSSKIDYSDQKRTVTTPQFHSMALQLSFCQQIQNSNQFKETQEDNGATPHSSWQLKKALIRNLRQWDNEGKYYQLSPLLLPIICNCG